jgi:hypothetical protein
VSRAPCVPCSVSVASMKRYSATGSFAPCADDPPAGALQTVHEWGCRLSIAWSRRSVSTWTVSHTHTHRERERKCDELYQHIDDAGVQCWNDALDLVRMVVLPSSAQATVSHRARVRVWRHNI